MTTPGSPSTPPSGYLPPAVVGGPARITVACIDMAATGGLASYVTDYVLTSAPLGHLQYTAEGSWERSRSWDDQETRNKLVDELAQRIQSGHSVALGIEAPLWGALDLPLGECFPRFSGEHIWYSGAGATVGVQAALMVPEMLAELARALVPYGITLGVTYGQKGQPIWQQDTLLLWESYNVGAKCCNKSSTSQHEQDARCGVEHGFLNFAARAESAYVPVKPSGQRRSLVGSRLFAHGLVSVPSGRSPLAPSPFWDDGCIVVKPSPIGGAAEQLWP